MSAANHTPGPWAYDLESQEVFSTVEDRSAGWIAKVVGGDSNDRPLSDEERLANASLILTAPELLRTLHRVIAECNCALDYVGVDDAHTLMRVLNRVGKARAVCEDAIAKSEGRAE
jgi:hypothetical protein